MPKGWIVLGFAAGYLVGSKAGRKQFDRIKSAATDLWERPEVQNTVKKVDDFVAEKAPAVHDLGAAAVDSVSTSSPSGSGSGNSSGNASGSGNTSNGASSEPTGSNS